MARARVTAATLKRLGAVEAKVSGTDADGLPRQGVMLVPPILDVDAWEALAVPSQTKLMMDAFSDIAVPARTHIKR